MHTYNPTNWKNAPDHRTTPMNADNLNNIEQGLANAYSDIAEVAGDVEDLDADKTEKTDIAPVEASATASQAHATGSQFYFNGQLVIATADINVGGTITLNGNCEISDSVTKQINDLEKYVKRHNSSAPITVTLPYTTPSDGYIVVYNHGVYLESTRTVVLDGRGVTSLYASCFVRKGQYIQEAIGSGTTQFVPLV